MTDLIESIMNEIVRLQRERHNGPYVFSYAAVARGVQSQSDRIAVQQRAIEAAFQKGADLAVFIANQRQNPQPPTTTQLDEMADLLVALRESLTKEGQASG